MRSESNIAKRERDAEVQNETKKSAGVGKRHRRKMTVQDNQVMRQMGSRQTGRGSR